MQNKIFQAQLKAKQAEKNLVSKKYDSGYPGVFGTMTEALDDASIAYGNKFKETIRSKQGFTQELLKRGWDDGMHVDHTRYLNDISSYRDMINIHKMKVTACNTLVEADLEFSKTEDEYNKFFSNWKIKTAESANRWSVHFDKLVIEENNPVANVAQNVPNQNPIPQGGDAPDGSQQQLGMALKIIEDFQKLLAAKDNIIDQNKLTIDEQKTTIDDLRIKLTDKTEELSANHTKYFEEHVKYIKEKHAVDLVKSKLGSFIGNHEDIDGHEQLTEMLGDLAHDAV
jgi:hypothetical protein